MEKMYTGTPAVRQAIDKQLLPTLAQYNTRMRPSKRVAARFVGAGLPRD
ncbi:hypothetical protein AWT69_000331 [Pseudomonas putida]|nr:hypothetical protein AWT69_000331 [Pseudomonas putida]